MKQNREQIFYKIPFSSSFTLFFKTAAIAWMGTFLALPVLAEYSLSGTTISADNPKLQYSGRVNFANPKAPEIYWAGSGVTIAFQGTDIAAKLVVTGDNYINVIIDNGEPAPLKVTAMGKAYDLAQTLAQGPHTVRLLRRVDFQLSKIAFEGFILHGSPAEVADLPAKPTRRIEFYGDSVTSGAGLENPPQAKDPAYENNYLAYGALTARALGADYRCISLTGIGILKSWFPLIMPNIYNRLNPADPGSRWNFSSWTPDVVVINLGQNDFWLIKPTDPATMETAYMKFFGAIRSKYPHARIIAGIGCMDGASSQSPFPRYISEAVAKMKDAKITSHIFKFTTNLHPNAGQQQAMADELIHQISQVMNWSTPVSVSTGN
jgi:lysophospholipase L1-like esterase